MGGRTHALLVALVALYGPRQLGLDGWRELHRSWRCGRRAVELRAVAYEERLDQPLEAARERFRRYGFRRTGIADIARDAGVAAGTVSRYFKDKEDLFRAVVQGEQQGWITRARAILQTPGSAAERLERLAAASVQFHGEHPLVASILSNDSDVASPPLLRELQERVVEDSVGPIAQVIREGIASGELRDLDPLLTARVLFLCGQMLFRQGEDYPELLRIFGELSRCGLSAEGPAKPAPARRRR